MSRRSVTFLLYPDDITLLHTIYPLLRSRFRDHLHFVTSPEEALRTQTRALCILRADKLFRKRADSLRFAQIARDSFDRLTVVDTVASAGMLRRRFLPFADRYFKRSLYADRELYMTSVQSRRLYVQHYVDCGLIASLSTQDSESLVSEPELRALDISWNIGLGSYPRIQWRKRLSRVLSDRFSVPSVRFAYRWPTYRSPRSERDELVSARFGDSFSIEGIRYHRSLFLHAAQQDPRFLTGWVRQREYNRELAQVAAVLSPFGYGEECLRDFEAVFAGAVLIKPDMSHVQTWPDIYQPWETYVPCRWDASDLSEVADAVLSDSDLRVRIASQAQEVLRDAYRRIDERVEWFMEKVLG